MVNFKTNQEHCAEFRCLIVFTTRLFNCIYFTNVYGKKVSKKFDAEPHGFHPSQLHVRFETSTWFLFTPIRCMHCSRDVIALSSPAIYMHVSPLEGWSYALSSTMMNIGSPQHILFLREPPLSHFLHSVSVTACRISPNARAPSAARQACYSGPSFSSMAWSSISVRRPRICEGKFCRASE